MKEGQPYLSREEQGLPPAEEHAVVDQYDAMQGDELRAAMEARGLSHSGMRNDDMRAALRQPPINPAMGPPAPNEPTNEETGDAPA